MFIANWNTQSKEWIPCNLYMDHKESSEQKQEDAAFVIPFGDSPEPIDMEDIGKGV